MRSRNARAAFTLLEMVLVLVIIGIVAGIAAPLFGNALDRLAVRRAADALTLAIARTRSEAVAHGGAALVLRVEAGRYRVEGDEGVRADRVIDLADRYGITLRASGTAARVHVRFDALGIGRMASRTVTISRGEAEARLIISSYGRVRLE